MGDRTAAPTRPPRRGLIRRVADSRAALWIAVLGIVGFLVWSIVDSKAGEQHAQTTAQQQAQAVVRVCDTQPAAAAAAGANCEAAAVVAQQGPKGDTGRGIAATAIIAGNLIVTYDDGVQRDVGRVVGEDGRGIATPLLDGGHLVLVFTDGQRVDLGQVVGAKGRGITSTSTAGGRLTITYDDGTTQDAGPLPQGDKGDPGQRGPAGPTCPDGFTAVETSGATAADGTHYARAITCVDPTSAQTASDGSGTGEEGGP